MEKSNISIRLTTILIILGVIIVFFLFGFFFAYFSNQTRKQLDSMIMQNVTSNQEEKRNEKEENSLPEKTSPTLPSNQNGISNTQNNSINTTSSSSSSVTGKTSSSQNPLSIGDWGIASKYSSGDYIDVPVKVTKIARGTEATQKIKEYCNANTYYTYSEPDEGMEWLVVDYSVDLTNIIATVSGKSITVTSSIMGTDSNAVRYNGHSYILTTVDMSDSHSKESIGNGSFAVQLPIGCTDYLIVMGSSSHTQSFFLGK